MHFGALHDHVSSEMESDLGGLDHSIACEAHEAHLGKGGMSILSGIEGDGGRLGGPVSAQQVPCLLTRFSRAHPGAGLYQQGSPGDLRGHRDQQEPRR